MQDLLELLEPLVALWDKRWRSVLAAEEAEKAVKWAATGRRESLRQAYLKGTELEGVDLAGADLRQANLHSARLSNADLREADLSEADLRYADLWGANLSGANFSGANLSGANLSKAFLAGADLSRAKLFSVNLSEAVLTKADLSRVHLREAVLTNVDLSGANLYGANIDGAELAEADLRGAALAEASLAEANLRCAKVTDEQLAQTKSLRGATMPDGTRHETCQSNSWQMTSADEISRQHRGTPMTAKRKNHSDSLSTARQHLGNAYQLEEEDKLKTALQECEAAIALRPDWAEAHNLRGIILDGLQDTESAIEAYREALAIDPRHSTAYYNLGVLYTERQRIAEASQIFEKCLQCTTDRNELFEIRKELEQLLNIRKMQQPTWVMGRRRVFQRSAATAQARILDRWKKRDYSGDSFGGWSGSILDLVLLLISLFVPSYIYKLVIQFNAVGPDFTSEQVTLEAKVTKEIYDHHPPGTTVNVRYSTEDPTIATLEHEYSERNITFADGSRTEQTKEDGFGEARGYAVRDRASSSIGWRFWLKWVLATIVGSLAGFVVSSFCGMEFAMLGVYGYEDSAGYNFGMFHADMVGVGIGTGFMQWLVLRRHIPKAHWWVPASIVGAVFGGMFGLLVGPPVPLLFSLSSFLEWGIGGALAGTLQWFILRRHTSRAHWWILASALGWAMSFVLLGPITGGMMVWLLRHPVSENSLELDQ